MLNYEQTTGFFPVNFYCSDPWTLTTFGDNWVILTMPYTDQMAVYDQINHKAPLCDPSNAAARAVHLNVMLCPSDSSYNRLPFNGSTGSETTGLGDNWARGDYGANGGLGMATTGESVSSGGPNEAWWLDPIYRGIMGINCSLQAAKVKDGLSNTILLGELRAGITPYDARGVWALGGVATGLWGCGGVMGDDYGPNCPVFSADDCINCTQIRSSMGDSTFMQTYTDELAKVDMPCSGVDRPNTQQTARSMHPNGVNVCLGDGSVRFIGDYIQVLPSSAGNFSVWDRLLSSADGQPLSATDY